MAHHSSNPVHLLDLPEWNALPAERSPYVAFISEIGAFVLESLSIAGGTITAITLLGTILCVHLICHREYGFEDRVSPQ